MASIGSGPTARDDDARRSRVQALRESEKKTARKRVTVMVTAAVIAVVAVMAAVVAVVHSSSSDGTEAGAASAGASAASRTAAATPVSWPAPSDPDAGIKAAGLIANPMESFVQHFHAHLDIRVDGTPVVVPQYLGINTKTVTFSELHTHDDSGALHVEASRADSTFVLGQLFTEWGLTLDATHIGTLTAADGETLTAWVDGKKFDGDPASIPLKNHEEIALVYGRGTPTEIPSGWDFAGHNL